MIKKAWQQWIHLSQRAGDVLAVIIFFIFYYIVLMPFALAVKLFSDPLKINRPSAYAWQERREKIEKPHQMQEQF